MHVGRWATPQNFCLAFIDKLEKQLLIEKNCYSHAHISYSYIQTIVISQLLSDIFHINNTLSKHVITV